MSCIEIVVRSPFGRSFDPDLIDLEDVLKIIKRQVEAEAGWIVEGKIVIEE